MQQLAPLTSASRTASPRWQAIVTVDEAFFKAYLAETKAAGRMQAEMAKALQMWASTMSRDVAARLVQGFLVRLYAPSQRKPRNVRLSLGFPPIRTPMIPVCWEVREAHLQVDKIG